MGHVSGSAALAMWGLGGYRSPIGLVGGARLRTRDPRDVCPSGTRGYHNPISRSGHDVETQNPGAPVLQHRGPM